MKLKEFYQFQKEIKKKNLTLQNHPLSEKTSFVNVPRSFRPPFSEVSGILICHYTLNNSIFTLTNMHGKVLASKSCGCLGFQGKKKRTTRFAVESTLSALYDKIKELKWSRLILDLKGFSKGRMYAMKSLVKSGFSFLIVRDKTSIPHNGCRPRKMRRG